MSVRSASGAEARRPARLQHSWEAAGASVCVCVCVCACVCVCVCVRFTLLLHVLQ